MALDNFVFTSESVTEGHPDKIADQISDAVLDAMIEGDPASRVACEVLVKTGIVMVAGEVRSNVHVDIDELVRCVIEDIGYTDSSFGFDARTCGVVISLGRQSADIAMGVDREEGEQGAGDQGLMFGYACDQTPELMPLPIVLAHALTHRLAEARKMKRLAWARPDGKSQVSVEYRNGRPARLSAIVVSCQHADGVPQEQIRAEILEKVIAPVIPESLRDDDTRIHINPTGSFVTGGPMGDAGLTGRKIIVDTYGGWARHGGGAFSGKDPSKVDRSAAYYARYVAKNIVAAGLARECEVQVAYAIGVADPVSVRVDTFGTHRVAPEQIEKAVLEAFCFKPAAIIEQLDLLRPIYRRTSTYGHFGREEPTFTWERTDRAEELKRYFGM